MSIDEILSGMDSKGKPARIAMPLSSLKAGFRRNFRFGQGSDRASGRDTAIFRSYGGG